MTIALYESLMGSSFLQLAPAVQAFHRLQGSHVLHGQVLTDAPASRLARVLARCLGTPLAATVGPIRFELTALPGLESWIRYFPAKVMRSTLGLQAGVLTEHLGLTRLQFELKESEGKLVMELKKLSMLGIPCPRWALPHVVAEETGVDNQLHFNVKASLPLIGQVAGYRGFLEVPREPSV